MTLRFTIPGVPVAKGRHRSIPLMKCRQCGKMTRSRMCRACGSTNLEFLTAVPYTEKETARFENLVKLCGNQAMKEAGQQELLAGPLSLHVCASFLIPPSRARKLLPGTFHAQRPDFDNIEKSITDGLKGVVYHDDGQIAVAEVRKVWSVQPQTEVEIETL